MGEEGEKLWWEKLRNLQIEREVWELEKEER